MSDNEQNSANEGQSRAGEAGANLTIGLGSTSEMARVFPMQLRERIRLAKAHMERTGQKHDVLWPYQEFRLTIGELLEAAERGA